MKHVVEGTLGLLAALGWLAGVVLATGGWLKALAVFLPFYAWYLAAERGMQAYGLLACG
jgi:hypothetical protein